MKDYLVRAMTVNKEIRAFAVRSTNVVEKARISHDTTPVATAALGRTLSAALMMGAMVKSGQEVGLRIIGDGPIKKIIVEANMYGEVRGYVGNPKVKFMTNKRGKLDVSKAIGKGTLYVRKVVGLKEPYEGSVPLISGEIGDDITYYFTQSEQTPSAVGLGVLINTDLSVKAAGGFIIQLLPEAGEETIDQLEKNLDTIKSVSRLIDKGTSPEDLLDKILAGFSYRILARQNVNFKCKCNRDRIKSIMSTLEKDDLEEILLEEGFVEIKCHFCGNTYKFNENDVKEVFEKKK